MDTEHYTVKGIIQVVDDEHRELWLEPEDGSARLIVHPKPYNGELLGLWWQEQRVVTVVGQLLPDMHIVSGATVSLDSGEDV